MRARSLEAPRLPLWRAMTWPAPMIDSRPGMSALDRDLAAEHFLQHPDVMLLHAQREHHSLDMVDVEIQRPRQRRKDAVHDGIAFALHTIDQEMKPFVLRGFHRNRVARRERTRHGREANVHAVENFGL